METEETKEHNYHELRGAYLVYVTTTKTYCVHLKTDEPSSILLLENVTRFTYLVVI